MNDRLRSILAETLNVDATDIDETYDLSANEDWDSLARVIVLSRLADEMGADIPLDDTPIIDSISDIERLLASE